MSGNFSQFDTTVEFQREKADDLSDHAPKSRNSTQGMDELEVKDPLLKGKSRYLDHTSPNVLKSFK